MHGLGHDRSGRVGTHAAGVRASIAVVARLVVLRACERHDGGSVYHRDEARLLALEELFDNDPGA